MPSRSMASRCSPTCSEVPVHAFVKLRQLLATHADLARKLDALERKYDVQLKIIFDAIRERMKPPEPNRRPMDFRKD